VYRLLLKSQWRGEGVPTCVVAGPNRHRAWLYVHAATPTVLRLHPQVVRFLLDALRELRAPTGGATACWRLARDTSISYPECVVIRYGDRAWLHLFAATPSAVQLAPPVVEFLVDALTELPTLIEAADEASSPSAGA
jgi:hypothetical protein